MDKKKKRKEESGPLVRPLSKRSRRNVTQEVNYSERSDGSGEES